MRKPLKAPNNIFRATVLGTPIAQPRAKKFFNQKTQKMQKGYVKSDHSIHFWRSAVAFAARTAVENGFQMIHKPAGISISLMFYFARPASWPKNLGMRHTKIPDMDNLVKAVKDACKGILYEDDSQVCDYVPPFGKRATLKQPRLEMVLAEVEAIPYNEEV